MSKTETLYYIGNLSASTIEEMRRVRKAFIVLSQLVENLGQSRELSEAFTHIETAQMYAIKHLCLVDSQGVKEVVE